MQKLKIIILIVLLGSLILIFINREKILDYLGIFSSKFYKETSYNISIIPEQEKPEMNASELEAKIHELINQERIAHNLSTLDWNNEIAEVARSHSQFMVDTGIFSHTNLQGQDISDRLEEAEIYYWNRTGENIFKINAVNVTKVYYINHKETRRVKIYYTQDELVEEIVNGWMDSLGHRKNILTPEFTEEGIGVLNDSEENYYITQNLITRAICGFKDGPCCPSPPGYLPSCYKPYRCVAETCQ
jgi:uncharacterized protein YkwD